jgi:hypothetical protein
MVPVGDGRACNDEQARSALLSAVRDLERRERDNQVEIADGRGR